MSANITNQVSFLRTSRLFPEDLRQLTVEVDKAYIDIANAVNVRTIGLFPISRPATTGDSYFITGNRRQQTVRQVFTFTAAGNIAHNINTSAIGGFTKIYGTFTNGTNWYPLPYVDVVAANNQVNVIVTPTNITITSGGGAPPAISSGIVILEWLADL